MNKKHVKLWKILFEGPKFSSVFRYPLILFKSISLLSSQSQVRAEILKSQALTGNPKKKGLVEQILDTLILQYFEWRGYNDSLTLFKPESDVSPDFLSLSDEELLRVLQIHSSSSYLLKRIVCSFICTFFLFFSFS